MIKIEEVKSNTYHYWIIYVNDQEWIRFYDREPNIWQYYSEVLKIEDGNIVSNNLESAIEEFKCIIYDYCMKKISEYESITMQIENEWSGL